MKWKKLGTWRTTYVWMTYILPYLRYGSLIFRDIEGTEGILLPNPSITRYNKIYNGSIKKMYDLARGTPNIMVNNILGSWNAHTAIM